MGKRASWLTQLKHLTLCVCAQTAKHSSQSLIPTLPVPADSLCPPGLAPLSSRPSSLDEPPGAPSLWSNNHRNHSTERASGHGSLMKSTELSVQSKQQDPECPAPGHTPTPRVQRGKRVHPGHINRRKGRRAQLFLQSLWVPELSWHPTFVINCCVTKTPKRSSLKYQ